MHTYGLDKGHLAVFISFHPLCSSHLHLQHLVENGLGQAFSDVSLVLPLTQPVSVLLVWNNATAPGDLQAGSGVSAARAVRNYK